MSLTIVDLQGFKNGDNDFIIKEAAILIDGKRLAHYIFEPPYDWMLLPPTKRREATWLVKNYHGLSWEDGFVPYKSAMDLLQRALQGQQLFYVKGEEKKTWLKAFIQGSLVVNIEDLGCDLRMNDSSNDITCAHHRGVCALNNVYRIDKWFRNTRSTIFTRILARRYPLNNFINMWLEVGIALFPEPHIEIVLIDRQKKEIPLTEEAFEKLHDQRGCVLRYLADVSPPYNDEILNLGEVKMTYGTVGERSFVRISLHDIDIMILEDTCKTLMRLHDTIKIKIAQLKKDLPKFKKQLDNFVNIVKYLENFGDAYEAITSSPSFRKNEEMDNELVVLGLNDILKMADPGYASIAE